MMISLFLMRVGGEHSEPIAFSELYEPEPGLVNALQLSLTLPLMGTSVPSFSFVLLMI
jgi:hypothetical protein